MTDRASEILRLVQSLEWAAVSYGPPEGPFVTGDTARVRSEIRAAVDALAAECERMRAVVEAALKLEIRMYAIYVGVADYEPKPEDYQQYVALEGAGDFRAAVDAYLATGPAAGAQE